MGRPKQLLVQGLRAPKSRHSGASKVSSPRSAFWDDATKPMQIGHKSLGLQELTYDVFGPRYAKRTQFRVVEGGTFEVSLCRKPARRRAWPTLGRVAHTGAQW